MEPIIDAINSLLEATNLIPDIEIQALSKDLAELLKEFEWFARGGDAEAYNKALLRFKTTWFETNRRERLDKLLRNISTLDIYTGGSN